MKDFIKKHRVCIMFCVPILLAEIGWRIHVETELNRSDRLVTIEQLIAPLVTEWKAEQLLRERGYIMPVTPHEHPEYVHEHPAATVAPPPAPPPKPEIDKAHRDAEHWTHGAIKQQSMRN